MRAAEKAGSMIPPLLLLGFGLAVLAASFSIRAGMLANDPGPAFLPRISGILLIALSLSLLVRRRPQKPLPRGGAAVRVVGFVLLTLLYLNALEPVGFFGSTALFLAAGSILTGLRHPLVVTAAPVIIAYAIYVLFRFGLEVALPATKIFGVSV